MTHGSNQRRIAWLFPGQGAQHVGMGKDFASASPAAAEVFARADRTLGLPLARICFDGTPEELARTDVQQPAIFATSVAIWAAIQERGGLDGVPGAAAGLSLGEWTALHVAGALSFEDGLRLVRRRGELMQSAALATPSGMVSLVGADEATADALCRAAGEGAVLVPANFNCPGQIVISGERAACERAVSLAEEFGCRAVSLKVAGAFHSPLMAPAAEGLANALAQTHLAVPRLTVPANVDGEYHAAPGRIRESLRQQLVQPVRWQKSVERLAADGFDTFVEVGPGRVLTGLLRKINRHLRALNVSAVADLDALSTASPASV